MSDESIWMNDDPEAAAKYPHYHETMRRLEAVLNLAQLQGVTGPQFASMLATLHATAIARLNPNEKQLELSVRVFREAVLTIQKDLITQYGEKMVDTQKLHQYK